MIVTIGFFILGLVGALMAQWDYLKRLEKFGEM
jgi:uncharacterized membrane protein